MTLLSWLTVRRNTWPSGHVGYELIVGRLSIDTGDISISWRTAREGNHTTWHQWFALRCCMCLQFTRGCEDHLFCGLCQPCADFSEKDDSDD